MSPFDPYLKWLGIKLKDQPPNHYRLLGVDEFTDDPEVIANAADRQMAHVRTFQSGQHGDVSQRLLNEVSAAKVCLLNADRKTDYDRVLKESLKPTKTIAVAKRLPNADEPEPSPTPTVVPVGSPVKVVAAPTPTNVSDTGGGRAIVVKSRPRGRGRIDPTPIVVAMGIALVGLIAWSLLGTSGENEELPRATAREDASEDSPRHDEKPSESKTHSPTATEVTRKDSGEPNVANSQNGETEVPRTDNAMAIPTDVESATEVDDRRHPLPGDEELKRSLVQARDLFGKDLEAARTREQKIDFAKKLLKASRDFSDNPVDRYAVLRAAREVATTTGDVALVMEIVNAMAADYEIDVLAAKAAALTGASKTVQSSEAHRELVAWATPVINAAASAKRFELALRLMDLAMEAARKSGKMPLVEVLVERDERLRVQANSYREVVEALETLKDNAADADANLVVGLYRCLSHGEWEVGLPMLAKSEDVALRSAATLDLAEPISPADQIAAGDSWWHMADAAEALEKVHLQQRAVFWYRKALPSITGLSRAKLALRLEQVDAIAKSEVASDGNSESGVGNNESSSLDEFSSLLVSKGLKNERGRWLVQGEFELRDKLSELVGLQKRLEGLRKLGAKLGVQRAALQAESLAIDSKLRSLRTSFSSSSSSSSRTRSAERLRDAKRAAYEQRSSAVHAAIPVVERQIRSTVVEARATYEQIVREIGVTGQLVEQVKTKYARLGQDKSIQTAIEELGEQIGPSTTLEKSDFTVLRLQKKYRADAASSEKPAQPK